MIHFLRQRLGRSGLILLGLVGLAFILDFIFFSGFYASDDISYLQAAQTIGEEGFLNPGLGNARLGITLPSALVWWITGGSITAIVWFHVGYHVVLVPMAYVLGRILFDERAGLIAAALIAINPLLYVFAGALLPDNAATFWLAGSMIALVVTARYTDPGVRLTSWNPRRFIGYFVAGAMVGFCYWCKETALILTIPAAVLIMTAGPSLRSLVWIQNGAVFALGLVAVFVLEALLLRVLTGQWINRLTFISDASAELVATMQAQGTTPFARLGYASDQMTKWMPLSMWFLIIGSIGYGLVRVRNVGIMMFLWWPALYLTMGSTTFSRYLPPPIQGRYYAIVIFPAAVMTGIAVSVLIERLKVWRPRVWTRLPLVLVLLGLGAYECGTNLPISGTIYRASEVRAFISALEQARDRYRRYPIVVSAHYGMRMLPLLGSRTNVWRDSEGAARPEPPYLYIKGVGKGDYPDPDPIAPAPMRVDLVLEVTPPRSRWVVIKDGLRRLFSAQVKPRVPAGNKVRGAEVYLVRPPAKPTPSPNPTPPVRPAP